MGFTADDKLGKLNYWIESSEFRQPDIRFCIALDILNLSSDPCLFIQKKKNDLAYNSEFPFFYGSILTTWGGRVEGVLTFH